MIEFATHDLAGTTVIEAAGRLDALASPSLDRALKRAVDAGRVRLLVDFASVAYISSSCLRILLLNVRRTRDQGGDLKVCCLSARVRQIFALLALFLIAVGEVLRRLILTLTRARDQLADLTTLDSFSRALLASKLDVAELCRLLQVHTAAMVDARHLWLGLIDSRTQRLEIVLATDPPSGADTLLVIRRNG